MTPATRSRYLSPAPSNPAKTIMPEPERGLSRLIPRDRLERVLGSPERPGRLSHGIRIVILLGVLVLIAVLVALVDPRPSLRHVKVAIASGSPSGNYFATVERIGAEVARQRGRVQNLPSAGSVANIDRLIAERKSCGVQFALVQGGIDWPPDHQLELIGKFPHPESMIILGRDADAIRTPADLNGKRIGIGPVGSGTEYLARRVVAPLPELELVLSTHPLDEQLDLLQRGALDLGVMVIDDEAELVRAAVRKRGLQILGLPDAAALAKHLPFTRVGTIEAGQYSYAGHLPPEDKRVLQVDALLVGNGCASLSQTQGLMTAVAEVFPTFVRHNRGQPNQTGLPMPRVAKSFFDDEGPDLPGQYTPWLVDIMPTATWLQLIVGFSMLFSGMALANRFRLWRLDAQRVEIERGIPELFGPGVTVGDIARMPADERFASPEARAAVDDVIDRLAHLLQRCRRDSLSVLVPMGEEMAYRHQETLVADLLHALRAFRDRLRPD